MTTLEPPRPALPSDRAFLHGVSAAAFGVLMLRSILSGRAKERGLEAPFEVFWTLLLAAF